MHDVGWQIRNAERLLSGFERQDHLFSPPGAQHRQYKVGRDTLGMLNRTVKIWPSQFSLLRQLLEGPLPARTEVVQRQFPAMLARDLPPTFVKHCQFGSAAIGCAASMISMFTDVIPVRQIIGVWSFIGDWSLDIGH